jgi:transketolase
MAEPLKQWKELAAQLRVDSIRCTTAPGSGHPTSSMAAADLMAVLLAKYLRFDWSQPHFPNNDRLIFSKGHACPLLYAMLKAGGMQQTGGAHDTAREQENRRFGRKW